MNPKTPSILYWAFTIFMANGINNRNCIDLHFKVGKSLVGFSHTVCIFFFLKS
jgi:hypothetical protein